MIAALAPRMLALAGEVADGTITWMTGPATIGDHIAPSINKSAEGAGRPAPRVIGALPVMVTDDPDAARARASEVFSVYNDLPSYRAMLDREGAAGPADVAVVGDEDTVRAGVTAMADAGCTDFLAVEFAAAEEERIPHPRPPALRCSDAQDPHRVRARHPHAHQRRRHLRRVRRRARAAPLRLAVAQRAAHR